MQVIYSMVQHCIKEKFWYGREDLWHFGVAQLLLLYLFQKFKHLFQSEVHFLLTLVSGASAVRELPPQQFCRQGFVLGKSSEAGFGNEMYKMLTAAALSIMLNRSLIIGQTRHIGSFSILSVLHQNFPIYITIYFCKLGLLRLGVEEGTPCYTHCSREYSLRNQTDSVLTILFFSFFRGKYPFGDYISYSNLTFTLKEIKHLWRKNDCVKKYKRQLVMRIDDFEKPAKTNALCSNWRDWDQPIIWFQGTTDAIGAQFFLKNVHSEMRSAAYELFGKPESLRSQPNIFGELMRVLISPSKDVEEAVNWVLDGVGEPDITLHMRMLMNRYSD
ncbi:hypothetical protein SLEP1_g35437 [Rubroshorea leprosula]|uniref:Uncharacterized protein n=2 Tax=Rubroshorea leprosula TaxID=152421 RepID=A0AAV5KND7_9ROSI|nr:hypothetical protein SLEP1_g35437 [Rubroshorea leprosula]